MGDVHNHYYMGKGGEDNNTVEVEDSGPAFPVQRTALAIIIVLILYFGYGYAKEKGLLETVPSTNGRLIMESNLVPQPKKKIKLRTTISDLQHQNAEMEKERMRFYESQKNSN